MKKHFSSCDECNALNVWCVSLSHAYAGSCDVCADCLIKAYQLLNPPDVEGNNILNIRRKPLLDEGEVWLALLVAGVQREKGISYMSLHIQDADEGLAEFRRRFRMGLREVGDPESSGT